MAAVCTEALRIRVLAGEVFELEKCIDDALMRGNEKSFRSLTKERRRIIGRLHELLETAVRA